jgi:hypothetical protein
VCYYYTHFGCVVMGFSISHLMQVFFSKFFEGFKFLGRFCALIIGSIIQKQEDLILCMN